jgi:hypothetical protein
MEYAELCMNIRLGDPAIRLEPDVDAQSDLICAAADPPSTRNLGCRTAAMSAVEKTRLITLCENGAPNWGFPRADSSQVRAHRTPPDVRPADMRRRTSDAPPGGPADVQIARACAAVG